MIDKASAEGISANGPRYQWNTDKGKNGGRIECFGEVLDLGADYDSEGARPTPRSVLVYGPYTGRQGVTQAAQVASAAARVLNEGGGELPKGEPIYLNSFRWAEDEGVVGLRQQIEQKLRIPNLKKYSLMVPTVGPSIWCGERMQFETTDGELFRVTVERVK